MTLKINTSHVIDTAGSDCTPDAVKVEIMGVTVTVNRHTALVTVDGAEHAIATEGDHNTLLVHACPSIKSLMDNTESSNPFTALGEEIMPGVKVGSLNDLINGLNNDKSGMPFSTPPFPGGFYS